MEYRLLGNTGLKVSPLCLGAMMFGGPTDAATAERIIKKAFDAGINQIDTADQYHGGQSERIVGAAIKPQRDNWIVSTKLANPMGPGVNQNGLSRKWIIQAVEDSLRRLDTDYIDILYFHREEYDTPLSSSLQAVRDLIRAGKVRYLGLSNFRAWRIAEVANLCDRYGMDRPAASQPYYNAMNRMPEVEVLPACAHYGIGVIPYSPLARGVLTGKYRPDAAPPPDTRAGRGDKRMLEAEWRKESLEIAQVLREHAEKKGITAGQFAVNWVLNNALVSATLVGPRTEAHLDDYLAALNYRFDEEDEALVDKLVTTGHPSTPGYNDPHYLIEGRQPRSIAPLHRDTPKPTH